MPYDLKKFKTGYKVCKKYDNKECYSKKPLPYKTAYKQRQAIGMSELIQGGDMKIHSYDKKAVDFLDERSDTKNYLYNILENFLKDSCPVNSLRTIAFDLNKIKVKDKNLKEKYTSLIRERADYNYLVDEETDENYLIQILIEAFYNLIEAFNDMGLSQFFCVDRTVDTVEHYFNAGNMADNLPYALLFEHKNDNILFRGIAMLDANYKQEIYVDYLCSSGGASNLLKYLRESMGKKKLLIDFSGVKLLNLSSATNYNTINFYAKEGALMPKRSYNETYRRVQSFFNDLSDADLVVYYDDFNTDIKTITAIKYSLYSTIRLLLGGTRLWFKDDIYDANEFVPADMYGLIKEILKSEIEKREPHSSINEVEISGGRTLNLNNFKNYLKKFKITENNYLINARIKAGNAGYDENKLFFADDGIHKLVYESIAGKIKFGRVGYKDYIIYKFIAHNEKNKFKKKKLEEDAEMYRERFHKSHEAISIKHKLGNLSPNELALKILW